MSVTDKRAALELHRLGRRDRDWIVGRLPADERDRVLPLLAELDGMDVRFDLDDSLALPARRADEPSPATGAGAAQSAAERLRATSPAAMARMLADEPAWLVRAVLAIEAWPWAAPVRAALPQPAPAPSGASAPTDRAPPEAFTRTLLETLAARLQAQPGTPPATLLNGPLGSALNGHHNGHRHPAVENGAWGRLWPRLQRWLR